MIYLNLLSAIFGLGVVLFITTHRHRMPDLWLFVAANLFCAAVNLWLFVRHS